MPASSITPTDLKARLDAGEDIMVVDVRNDWELELSQLDFAKHIVMDEIPSSLDEIPKDKPVVFVCRSGNRSMQVGNFLVSRGWNKDKVLNLEGGILAWANEVDSSLPGFY